MSLFAVRDLLITSRMLSKHFSMKSQNDKTNYIFLSSDERKEEVHY